MRFNLWGLFILMPLWVLGLPQKKSPKYGLAIGIQYGTHFLAELNFMKASGNNMLFKRKSAGLEFSPKANLRYVGGKLSYHTNLFKVLQIGGNTLIYTNGKKAIPALRPELGYSIKNKKLDIRVGYNFHLLKNDFQSQLNTFQFTLLYNIWT